MQARLFCSILFPILTLACPVAADCRWKSGSGSRVTVAEGEVNITVQYSIAMFCQGDKSAAHNSGDLQ